MEKNRIVINGISLSYYGRIPSKKRIFIASAYKSSRTLRSLYMTAFEAVRNGYSVLFIPFSESAEAIESGVLDASGPINYILPSGLGKTSRRMLYKAMITSGSAISAEEDEKKITAETVKRAKNAGAMISDAIIAADDMLGRKGYSGYIDNALDMGISVAVLRDALTSVKLREYAASGAPVIGTFSDFLSLPKCYLYRADDGTYSFRGEKFAIMKLTDD